MTNHYKIQFYLYVPSVMSNMVGILYNRRSDMSNTPKEVKQVRGLVHGDEHEFGAWH